MNRLRLFLLTCLQFALITGVFNSKGDDKPQDKSKNASSKSVKRPSPAARPDQRSGNTNSHAADPGISVNRPGGTSPGTHVSPSDSPKNPSVSSVPGTEVRGKESVSGQAKEREVTKPVTEQPVQHVSVTGRVDKQEVRKPDGTVHATSYDLGHREKKVEVVRPDGSKETTDVHYNRNGEVRAKETVRVDAKGTPVSKTVVVKNNLVIHNTTVNNITVINNTTVVKEYHREYVRSRYGFVYAPLVIAPVVYVGWYDPFWYAPPLVVGGPVVAIRTHSFRYSWGWEADPWYGYHRRYWEPYPVYAGPSYWVTDWMVAGYLADRYAVAVSVEQTREEVRLAREEAAKANQVAEQARDQAQIADARAAASAAELRAANAEARAAKAEAAEAKRKELADKPNPNATPIDKATKDALNNQIEKTIAEKKAFADQSATGAKPVPPDVSIALADPKHIYPVSKTISVLSIDEKPAGNLTGGDLLRVEPGQEAALKEAKENDFVAMKVMTSKGEEDEVAAGVVVKIPLKDLQEFDNEFRAKLDQGLELAALNKDQFKNGAQQQ